jgi:hypothetical protein
MHIRKLKCSARDPDGGGAIAIEREEKDTRFAIHASNVGADIKLKKIR